MEERVVVERERVGDLVDHLELRLAQQVGAPQDEHRAPQLLLVERQLRFGSTHGASRSSSNLGDLELAGERALAPHFGRMGGQDRAHQRAIEEVAERGGLDAHLARALKRVGERAGTRRRAGDRMRAVAADVMLVLGDVGEVREIAVGAHDRQRLVGVEAVERRLELAPRADLVVAMEADRGAADLLDQLEDFFALLLAHGVAEDSAEQADVLAQRDILVGIVRKRKVEALDSGGASHRAHPLAKAKDWMLHCGRLRRKAER